MPENPFDSLIPKDTVHRPPPQKPRSEPAAGFVLDLPVSLQAGISISDVSVSRRAAADTPNDQLDSLLVLGRLEMTGRVDGREAHGALSLGDVELPVAGDLRVGELDLAAALEKTRAELSYLTVASSAGQLDLSSVTADTRTLTLSVGELCFGPDRSWLEKQMQLPLAADPLLILTGGGGVERQQIYLDGQIPGLAFPLPCTR